MTMKFKDKIADKLLQEFKYLKNEKIKEDIDAVVVLSAEEVEIMGENKERITVGLKLALKKSIPLIFLGTKTHNKFLKKYINGKNIGNQIYYPVLRINATTKTQIQDLSLFLEKHPFKSLQIVSHIYHLPRIKRYCKKYLCNTRIYFYGIGNINEQSQQIFKEVEKIIQYSKKGDLALNI